MRNVQSKKRAFDISTLNMDALHLGDNSAVSDLLADYIRREPKWVVAVEERFKFLVMGKTKGGWGGNLRAHVFCPVTKEKRDVIKLIAERWKLVVQAAGWEPKRFIVVHVTPKSKPPARILGPKSGPASSFSPPPPFDSTVDMDPRLVVAMFDLPRDAEISALVLRFGIESELVWLNDKNALAIFSDPARAATALRRLDHGSPYQDTTVLKNSGTSVMGIMHGAKESVDETSYLGIRFLGRRGLVFYSSRCGGSFMKGFGGLSSAGQDIGTGKAPMHEEVDNLEEACD